jgi:hypothetical protein
MDLIGKSLEFVELIMRFAWWGLMLIDQIESSIFPQGKVLEAVAAALIMVSI